jgi:hypothetical protein
MIFTSSLLALCICPGYQEMAILGLHEGDSVTRLGGHDHCIVSTVIRLY